MSCRLLVIFLILNFLLLVQLQGYSAIERKDKTNFIHLENIATSSDNNYHKDNNNYNYNQKHQYNKKQNDPQKPKSKSKVSHVEDSPVQDACQIPYYWSGRRNVTISVPIPLSTRNHMNKKITFNIKREEKEEGKIDRVFELYSPFIQRFNSTLGECGDPRYCTAPPEKRGKYGVVINWHGCCAHYPLLDYTDQISKVVQVAQDRNYYVITPVGTNSVDGNVGWNADGIPCGSIGVDDFAFFESILEFIETKLCADMSRIYTIGFSTGAFLSYGIGCRYPHRIAGIGADAGGLSRTFAPKCKYDYQGAVPVQSFHSLSDPTVPYNGTEAWVSQDDMNAIWRYRNGCTKEDEYTKVEYTFVSDTTICKRWNCPLAPVESCALKDIDHCWYGGRSGGFPVCEPRRGDIDATNHMFDFWEENSRKIDKKTQ